MGLLVPVEPQLNPSACLSIVADHVHPFMTTVLPSSDDYFQQDKAPNYTSQLISDWFLEHDNELFYSNGLQSQALNPIEHRWDVVEWVIHMMDVHHGW